MTTAISRCTDTTANPALCAPLAQGAGAPCDPRRSFADVTVVSVSASECCDREGAVDVDVRVVVGGAVVGGGVTLMPSNSGAGYETWGSLDHWLSGPLVALVRDGVVTADEIAEAAALAAETEIVAADPDGYARIVD